MSDRLTAMDVEGQQFQRKFRGYDPEEVRLYLESVAEEIGRLNLENAELKENAGRLRKEVEEFLTREKTLQETMVTAQKVSDGLRRKAESEAELMIKEARIKAERMLLQAQEQLVAIEAEISSCKLERELFENRVRAVIDEHNAILESRKADREQVQNVRFMTRRSETG